MSASGKLISVAFLVSLFQLGGCVATNPLQEITRGAQDILTSTSAPKSVSVSPIVLKIPNDSGIQMRQPAAYSTVIVRDVGIDSRVQTVRPGTIYARLLTESLTPNSFVVHARTDNGTAGSGVKYQVNYSVENFSAGYQVKFTPISRSEYQTGLIGKFPVPLFGEPELRDHLSGLQLVYKFEIDSPYNSESIISNFTRKAQAKADARGWSDPVTGKIFGRHFISDVRGKKMPYSVEVFPYRNGSKAVITAIIPGVETSAQTVDYSILIREIRLMLEGIVRA